MRTTAPACGPFVHGMALYGVVHAADEAFRSAFSVFGAGRRPDTPA